FLVMYDCEQTLWWMNLHFTYPKVNFFKFSISLSFNNYVNLPFSSLFSALLSGVCLNSLAINWTLSFWHQTSAQKQFTTSPIFSTTYPVPILPFINTVSCN